MPRTKAPCRHCGIVKPIRVRRLCWNCSRDFDILRRYPPDLRFGSSGFGLGFAGGHQPAFPTACLPGTDAKIEVMAERAARRETLFHPADGLVDQEIPARRAG